MTYKQLTKEIESVDDQIRFLYEIRDKYFKNKKDKYKASMIGNAVNSLCAYKNYLRYSKEYKPKFPGDSRSQRLIESIKNGDGLPPLPNSYSEENDTWGLW